MGAFIDSDTQLVVPVTRRKNAKLDSGSTITKKRSKKFGAKYYLAISNVPESLLRLRKLRPLRVEH